MHALEIFKSAQEIHSRTLYHANAPEDPLVLSVYAIYSFGEDKGYLRRANVKGECSWWNETYRVESAYKEDKGTVLGKVKEEFIVGPHPTFPHSLNLA